MGATAGRLPSFCKGMPKLMDIDKIRSECVDCEGKRWRIRMEWNVEVSRRVAQKIDGRKMMVTMRKSVGDAGGFRALGVDAEEVRRKAGGVDVYLPTDSLVERLRYARQLRGKRSSRRLLAKRAKSRSRTA